MNTQHTPGPWHVGGTGSASAHGAARVWANDRAAVCEISTRRTLGASETPEMDANARLIAAAPDMLAALRELVDRCDGESGVRADGSNIDTCAAHAAIAKATGEQS